MDDKTIHAGVAIVAAFVGLAMIAVLVSQKSQTAGVTQSAGSSLASALSCALSPVTGASCGSRSLIPNVNSTIHF